MPDHSIRKGRTAAGLIALMWVGSRVNARSARLVLFKLLLLQSAAFLLALSGPTRLAHALVACALRSATAVFIICRGVLYPFVRVTPSSHLVIPSGRPAGHSLGPSPGLNRTERRQLPPGSSFSFCGCSWMLFYHLGVASVIQQHLERPNDLAICGASCGSLVAAALAIDVPMDQVLSFGLELHAASDKRLLGPAGDMSRIVGTGLRKLLPADAHEKMNRVIEKGGKLAISVSVWDPPVGLRNVLDKRRRFNSRDELITLLLASCYIPLYYEQMQWYCDEAQSGAKIVLDGGATDNMPVIDRNTVTVSPKLGAATISPQTRCFPESISIMPGSKQDCLELFEQGRVDACRFVTERIGLQAQS